MRASKAEKERDVLVGILVGLFGWKDKSYLHAVLHVENAVNNLKADASVALKEVAQYRLFLDKSLQIEKSNKDPYDALLKNYDSLLNYKVNKSNAIDELRKERDDYALAAGAEASERRKAHAEVDRLTQEVQRLNAEIVDLKMMNDEALKCEKEWTSALAKDGMELTNMLDSVCDVIGHKGRTDFDDVAKLVNARINYLVKKQRLLCSNAVKSYAKRYEDSYGRSGVSDGLFRCVKEAKNAKLATEAK